MIKKCLYIILCFVLLHAVIFTWDYVWKACYEYSCCSADALVGQALEEVREKHGLELECSMIPRITENGERSTYTLCLGGRPVGQLGLRLTGHSIMDLALYERESLNGLLSYTILIGPGCTVSNGTESIAYAPDGEDEYYFLGNGAGLQKVSGQGLCPQPLQVVNAENIMDFSQISVTRDGTELPLVQQDDGSYLAFTAFPKEEAEAILARADKLMRDYSLFCTKDLEWKKLSGEICADSPLQTLNQIRRRVVKHKKTDFEVRFLSEPMDLGDGFAQVNVAYDFKVYRSSTAVTVYPTEISFTLHKDPDGVWRIAEMGTNLTDQLPEHKAP